MKIGLAFFSPARSTYTVSFVAERERAYLNQGTIVVTRVRITDAGRKVLAASAFNLCSVKCFTPKLPTICQKRCAFHQRGDDGCASSSLRLRWAS